MNACRPVALPIRVAAASVSRPGEAGAIQILQLDVFGYYLLGLVDGLKSVADLSAALGCSRRPARQFLRALRQMASCGVLRFDAGARARAR